MNDASKNIIKFFEGLSKHSPSVAYANGDADSPEGIAITTQILEQGLSEAQKTIVAENLKKVELSLKDLYIRTDFEYKYESSYLAQSKLLLEKLPTDRLNRKLFNGLVVSTSKGRPLYILQDYFYHKELQKSGKTLVQITGRDHYKHNLQLAALLPRPPETVFYSKLINNGLKLSKRNENTFDLKDWYGTSPDEPFIKALVFKFMLYYNARTPVIDLNVETYEKYRPYICVKPKIVTECNLILNELMAVRNLLLLKVFLNKDIGLYGKYLEELFRVAKKGLSLTQKEKWQDFLSQQ